METRVINPESIYFTHSKIRPFFSGCAAKIEDTIQSILQGKLSIENIPIITVIETNDHLFSLNNRRLYLFKYLKREGFLDTVQVRIKQPLPREIERYTVSRCSLSAKIMKERGTEGKKSDSVTVFQEFEDKSVCDQEFSLNISSVTESAELSQYRAQLQVQSEESGYKKTESRVDFKDFPEKVRKNHKVLIKLMHKGKFEEVRKNLKLYVDDGTLSLNLRDKLENFLFSDVT